MPHSKMSVSTGNIVTYEYVVGQDFPPVLIVEKKEDGSSSSPLPVSTRTVWIDSVNALVKVCNVLYTSYNLPFPLLTFVLNLHFLQNFISQCQEGEKKIERVIDVVLQEKLGKKEAKTIVDGILLDIATQQLATPAATTKMVCEAEKRHMTLEQKRQVEEYFKKIRGFITELTQWVSRMMDKIVDESFEGKKLERNITSKFFQALMQAFQQANLVDLINSDVSTNQE